MIAECRGFEPSVSQEGRRFDAARILEGKMPETSKSNFEKRSLLTKVRGSTVRPTDTFNAPDEGGADLQKD
jgi:hypothetical protein